MEYVTNSQYWFIIRFAFSSGIIPTFSFKVQINPIHANNFTPQEMALNVFGQISEATAYTETSIEAPQPPQPFLSQSPTFGSGANGNRIAGGPSSTLVDASTLSQIFGWCSKFILPISSLFNHNHYAMLLWVTDFIIYHIITHVL